MSSYGFTGQGRGMPHFQNEFWIQAQSSALLAALYGFLTKEQSKTATVF